MMMWGVWLVSVPRSVPTTYRGWLLDGSTLEPTLSSCRAHAEQRAVAFSSDSSYQKYSSIEVRRYDPQQRGEQLACVPDLSFLAGWFV